MTDPIRPPHEPYYDDYSQRDYRPEGWDFAEAIRVLRGVTGAAGQTLTKHVAVSAQAAYMVAWGRYDSLTTNLLDIASEDNTDNEVEQFEQALLARNIHD